MPDLRIAMVASEMTPFAKTGGLADVVGSLPFALGQLGVEVHVFLPRYGSIRETRPQLALGQGVSLHFIDHEPFFNRPGLYGNSDGDYPDNLERFSFFCRKALTCLKREELDVDLVHAHDWQAALSVVYLKTHHRQDPFFSKMKTVLTIHNLAYQGVFSRDRYPRLELPWELFGIEGLEFYDKVNLLKGGLLFADLLTTVSPTYAREIQTLPLGAGLDGVLRMRAEDLVGILNGIDGGLWNPATDERIGFRYSENRLQGKAKNKAALQKALGLPVDRRSFLIGMVSRLDWQKGLDLVKEAALEWRRLPVQLVILGEGDKAIERALAKSLGGLSYVRLKFIFDEGLAHRIYAASDIFLMPSRYEPCGLGQMIAMRYGAVPVVRATGGLLDTVVDVADSPEGNGFCFGPYEAQALTQALKRALAFYEKASNWQALARRGMKADFSWNRAAQAYLRLYEKLASCSSLA